MNSKRKKLPIILTIALLLFVALQAVSAKMVPTEEHKYTGTDGLKYQVTWYIDDITGDKFSKIKIEGLKDPVWRNGHVKPKYPEQGLMATTTDFDIKKVEKLNIKAIDIDENDNSFGELDMPFYEPEVFMPESGTVKCFIHKNLLDIKYCENEVIEISVADDSNVDIIDLSTGQVIFSNINIKGDRNVYKKINLSSYITDKKRPYGIVVKQSGQIFKTETFYFE